ncbi:uncharacterized protein LOC109401706 [Aedes albopictus]|uniref:Uncharacterized protein n=1 Tax=Aedes albopictus TaxID=7160 RepID=A0ABM1ZGG3_AEDAL
MNRQIWNVGSYRDSFQKDKYPSTRNVLQVFFHYHRKQNMTVPASSRLVAKAVHNIWLEKNRQPQKVPYISKKIGNLFSKWRKLLANRKKSQSCYKLKRQQWRDNLPVVFDVSRSESRFKSSKESLPETESVTNSIQDSELSDANSDWDDATSDYSEPLPKKQKIEPWKNEALTLLDRAMVTDTAASAILTATAVGLGLNTNSVASSRSSLYRRRTKARVEQMENAQKEFSPSEAVVIHIDTKRMKKGVGLESEERLAVTTSGFGTEQIVGVPVIPTGTGKDIAQAVVKLLEEKGIENSIKGICYDTTAANSGIQNGSVVLLEKLIGRSLLRLPCRHHILELILEAVFTKVFSEKSSGPEITIFKRFQKEWPGINKDSYKGAKDLISPKLIPAYLKSIETLHHMKKIRADYQEFIELTALLLGVETLNGSQIKIKSPGAMHRARWMSRALYSLKMYLFREQFKLDKSEIRALRRINKFIVLVYLDAWFAAPAGPSAPRHDLQLLSKLKSYKDSEIRIVAQNKLLRHE